ncbi:MAG: YdcF family protein [Candidatus Pacebacteria bacterium]|nr:YdcF family protein [Candidatus Paceibacterota bacterium]
MQKFGLAGLWLKSVLIGPIGLIALFLIGFFVVYRVRLRLRGQAIGAIPAVCTAAAFLLIACFPYPAYLLERPLIRWGRRLERHSPVDVKALRKSAAEERAAILVLGGGLAGPGRLSEVSLARLEHGIALWNRCPDALFVFTEGKLADVPARVEAYLTCRGIARERLVFETQAANTRENMQFVHDIFTERGITNVVLVTSQRHLPRSYLAARHAGFDPMVSALPSRPDLRAYPSWDALSYLYAVLNEYVGLLGYRAVGWL